MNNLKDILKDRLTEEKYIHSLGVQEAAVELASQFGVDTEKASLAGLLHDYAKSLTNNELLKAIEENNIEIFEEEQGFLKTLHAPVGAYLVQKDLGITDPEIISAIRFHTIGDFKMSLLDKIIYVADKIETRTRDKEVIFEITSEIKQTNSIECGMAICYRNTISHLVSKKLPISLHTVAMWNSLLSTCNKLI